MSVLEDRLGLYLLDAMPHRVLSVAISHADERRLRRYIEAINREIGGAPIDPDDEFELGRTLVEAAALGLEEAESEDGVWSDLTGRCLPLPRPSRASWRHRLAFAWRAACMTWRAS